MDIRTIERYDKIFSKITNSRVSKSEGLYVYSINSFWKIRIFIKQDRLIIDIIEGHNIGKSIWRTWERINNKTILVKTDKTRFPHRCFGTKYYKESTPNIIEYAKPKPLPIYKINSTPTEEQKQRLEKIKSITEKTDLFNGFALGFKINSLIEKCKKLDWDWDTFINQYEELIKNEYKRY